VEITVEDTELGIPLEGAIIRAWDGREYVCDADGKAVISAPDDRTVIIRAAYPGYESGRTALAPETAKLSLGLRLSGVMESRELIIEASRPETGETKTGRSVAVSEREIAQTGEIGIIQDVMTTIKLLPGVGYAGFFNAQPSIRGGDPGDMSAFLDGYYIDNPYHWGGGFSIFDPRMVESAQLSHGVFSVRYGHTISGILEVTSKKPSPTETEFELSVNTSAANFNLSFPLGKGGIMFMGRVTYYDPVVWLAKQLAGSISELNVINYVRVAPYIRNGTITANYRFFDDLEFQAAGFWGMDGVGVSFENSSNEDGLHSNSDVSDDYVNYQGFITAGLSWNPRNDMLLKGTVGAGYHQMTIDGVESYDISKEFSDEFNARYASFLSGFASFKDPYNFTTETVFDENTINANAQGRIDWDWDIGKGFLGAAGIQELFSHYTDKGFYRLLMETSFRGLSNDDKAKVASQLGQYALPPELWDYLIIHYPTSYAPNVDNHIFSTSGYALVEYKPPDGRFGAELGLRLDHFFLLGKGFSVSTSPVLNPRLSTDFNVLKDRGLIESLDLSAGTGLFSSINNMVSMVEERFNLSEGKPNRSWTSVLGAKITFPYGLSFNIEGYYKYVFDRAYIPVEAGIGELKPKPSFDGEGRIWGIDVMLQKIQSRYWDGWVSYSFNWAKYRDPQGGNSSMGYSGGNRGTDWYFPSYHRFHNLNLILNIKPTPRINIYTHFGFADGTQLTRITGPITSYPVYVLDQDVFIEKYRRAGVRDENNRATPTLSLDAKLSILGHNEKKKTQYELYVALENMLALVYSAQGNTRFNTYTGKEDTGSNSASYGLPIPIPSFGFKISY
jgi:hypothetical protein